MFDECSIVQDRCTPLWIAANYGHQKMVQYLYKQCEADLNQPNKVLRRRLCVCHQLEVCKWCEFVCRLPLLPPSPHLGPSDRFVYTCGTRCLCSCVVLCLPNVLSCRTDARLYGLPHARATSGWSSTSAVTTKWTRSNQTRF